MDPQEKQRLVEKVPSWFHSIDLGDGIVTPGIKTPEQLQHELRLLSLPRLAGQTVLDVGAWDGFFSFAAEQRGARRVVALDHYVWGMDIEKQREYAQRCHERGISPQQHHRVPGLWNPGSLPGKAGFDTAHRILGSNVEQVVGDFLEVDPDDLGSFDVVLFLGVLYHLRDPFRSLRRIALLTRGVAIIETASVFVKGLEDHAFYEFYGEDELGGDPTNWWAPNAKGLRDALLAAGFREARIVAGDPPAEAKSLAPAEVSRGRLIAHAFA